MSRPATYRAGFSLLEVLVAVAVLALLYTSLAGVSMQGLRMEGDAGRRFEASLLADSALNEIENEFRLGGVPRLGRDEAEQDIFRVETNIEAYDPSQLNKSITTRRKSDPREEPPAPALFAPVRGASQPFLYHIHVAVFWEEAGNERSVERTTFGFDAPRAASLLSSEEGENEDEDAEDGGDEASRADDLPTEIPEEAFE